MFTSPNPTLTYAKAGKLRALAMTGAKRSPAAPELPTVAEAAGLPGYEASLWYGIVVPAKTPGDIVQVLHREIAKGMQTPDVRNALSKVAVEVIAGTPEEFATHLKNETEKWSKVIKEANIRAD
jgi:tripartite-type tricarboxylate transporter receptor subunit TctC